MRTPSSSSTSATTYPSSNHGNCGWRGCTALTTTPRPDDSVGVQSSERQCGHIGRGGCRSTPQPSQRWINRRRARSPSQKNCVSGVTVGPSRSGRAAVVCPAPVGFIGSHLVRQLKAHGWWVRGRRSRATPLLTRPQPTSLSGSICVTPPAPTTALAGGCNAVFHLTADMGGMGFISDAECEVLRNNALVDINMVHAAAEAGVARVFLQLVGVLSTATWSPASPVCTSAIPTRHFPTTSTGGRSCTQSGLRSRMPVVPRPRRARRSLRELLRARRRVDQWAREGACCAVPKGRRVQRSRPHPDLGRRPRRPVVRLRRRSRRRRPATRAIRRRSSRQHRDRRVRRRLRTRRDDAYIAGKRIEIDHVFGPIGVRDGNSIHTAIEALGWRPRFSLHEGLRMTYPWIAEQVAAPRRCRSSCSRLTSIAPTDPSSSGAHRPVGASSPTSSGSSTASPWRSATAGAQSWTCSGTRRASTSGGPSTGRRTRGSTTSRSRAASPWRRQRRSTHTTTTGGCSVSSSGHPPTSPPTRVARRGRREGSPAP